MPDIKVEDVRDTTPEEIAKAFKVAAEKTSEVKIDTKAARGPGGTKRLLVKHGKYDREPFTGLSHEDSDAIRTIIGARFAKFTFAEACGQAGISTSKGYRIEREHYEAVQECIDEHLTIALQNYQRNILICRTALSDAGPKAIATLERVMESKKVAPGVRVKAAIAILKLLNIDNSATGNPDETIAAEFLKVLKGHMKKGDSENEYVVDAVEVEAVEGNEDGSGMGDTLRSD